MVKKRCRIITAFCLIIGCGIFFTGCGAVDSLRQALQQAAADWEAEESAALRSELELTEQTPTQAEQQEEAATEPSGETQATDSGGREQELSFTAACSGTFAYDALTEPEQVWYRNINRILGKMQEKQELAGSSLEQGLDETHIDRIFQCVLNDHPEYFYVEGYTYTKYTRGEKLVKIEFSGTYSLDPEEAMARSGQIEEAVAALLGGVSADAPDYDKVRYVYETLIRSTDYDLTAPDNQNIYSVFVNHRSVCQGYAKATQYLLNRLGMECTMVMGTVDTGEGHAWNLVKADGSYYYLDTTWGDASYQTDGVEDPGLLPEINYDYLLVTTEQLLRTHTLGGPVPMPQCVAAEDNYYVREGAYFTAVVEEQLAAVFTGALAQGRTDITLKCADLEVYREMERLLIGEQGIFKYLDIPGDTVCYAGNEKQLSITFWMTKE